MRTLLAASLAVTWRPGRGRREAGGHPREQIKAIEKEFKTASPRRTRRSPRPSEGPGRPDYQGQGGLGKLAKEATAVVEANPNDATVAGPGCRSSAASGMFGGDAKGTYRKVLAGTKTSRSRAWPRSCSGQADGGE